MFWKKRRKEDDFSYLGVTEEMRIERIRKKQQENYKKSRRWIDGALNAKHSDLEYKFKAREIASKLPEKGRTKKELLVIAYQQVRDSLNQENTWLDCHFQNSLDMMFDGQTFQYVTDYITPRDRERYVQNHRQMIDQRIKALETSIQQEQEALLTKQQLHHTVSQKLAQIQDKQTQREADLDRQLADVRQRSQALKEKLAQHHKQTPTAPDPALDHLETLLEQLRRLKHGMD